MLIFLVKIIFPIYANKFCDAGQVPILRYFEAWSIGMDRVISESCYKASFYKVVIGISW